MFVAILRASTPIVVSKKIVTAQKGALEKRYKQVLSLNRCYLNGRMVEFENKEKRTMENMKMCSWKNEKYV